MSEKKYADDDPERTLITLDQLSQTIEVMTSVVNRLRRHLSDQIKAQLESQIEAQVELESLASPAEGQDNAGVPVADEALQSANSEQNRESGKERESFVVEISQQEVEPTRKSTKVLH
jgi:hypothetical protein